MSPKLAQAVCFLSIFILFCFEIRRSRESSVSAAIWIPLLWMIKCGSRSITFWLNPRAQSAIDTVEYLSQSNPIDRNFFILLMVIGIFVLVRRNINWSELLRNNFWLIALFLIMGISILWSDFKSTSFKRWFRAIGDLIMVMIVITEDEPFEAIKRIFRRCAYVLIPCSVLLVKYFREIGVIYGYDGTQMWVGVTGHKNTLGMLTCFCAIYFLGSIIRQVKSGNGLFNTRNYVNVLFLLMALWLLNASGTHGSKTSMLVFILGSTILITLYFLKTKTIYINRFVLIFIGTVFLAQIAATVILQDSILSLVVKSTGRDLTFTGRTPLWSELIRIGSNNLLLGSGYGAFWLGDHAQDLWNMFIWRPTSAHDGYIDVFLQLGIIGLFVLLLYIITTYKDILTTFVDNFEYGQFRLTFLGMILIYNITETSFIRATSFSWFIFLLIAIATLQQDGDPVLSEVEANPEI